mmetsp:Transcript_14690/g.21676  ORF Transcript_14690/g.21676 Transcript_14690/m.21676 type:complete len:197 (-) Transcript_14690:118-708(-)
MNGILGYVAGGFSLNLTEQLVFYGSYHHNPMNQLIHVIFVPLIWFTAIVFLTYSPECFPSLASKFSFVDRADAAMIVTICEGTYYIFLDRVVGGSYALILYFMHRFARSFAETYGWKVALGLHMFSWYMQIHPGHIVLEKRKPALLDSLAQSLVLAPLFVWFEVLFYFGFRKKYKEELDEIIEKRIAAFDNEKKHS